MNPLMPHAHTPRKRFGQHFLTDARIIARIVQQLNPQKDEILVEIGAGLGALTRETLQQIPHMYVVEIDRDLSAALAQNYPHQLTIFNEDALQFDFSEIPLEGDQKIRLFGNLPYNISTPLLFHALIFAPIIKNMLFMLQKEVVMRMCAPPNHKDYGRLSVMVQYACQCQHLFDIGPQAFSPPPKVMSSIVVLTPYTETNPRPFPTAQHYQHFANVVNRAFQHRRKTLKNALEGVVSPEVFAAAHIDPIRRAETLSVTEYVQLSNLEIGTQEKT